MEAYQTWARAMLNPKNYQVDFEMTIGPKKYNSFSATVGSFSSKASQNTETGQYNIAFKHGDIVHDAGYNEFIAQLAPDYGCSVGEAEALFEDSQMKQAVIKAIEHDNSTINKSAPAKYVGDTLYGHGFLSLRHCGLPQPNTKVQWLRSRCLLCRWLQSFA